MQPAGYQQIPRLARVDSGEESSVMTDEEDVEIFRNGLMGESIDCSPAELLEHQSKLQQVPSLPMVVVTEHKPWPKEWEQLLEPEGQQEEDTSTGGVGEKERGMAEAVAPAAREGGGGPELAAEGLV